MKTIFGVATPLAKSGVAVIRISGDRALAAAKEFGIKSLPARKAVLRKLHHQGRVIDEAVVIYFKAPHSFTGEDVVELQTHGSRAVIKSILAMLGKIPDCRLAEPGEFSRRAFANGKMDLTQAEGLADLIEAETESQRRQALRQMQGELGKIYETWRQALIKNLSQIEAYIDFPDEDLPKSLSKNINASVEKLTGEIKAHLNDKARGERIREGIHVVILGAPNVGKSSLLNYLVRKEAAIVSETAGTTRDVIEVNMDIGGYAVTLADTAGLRETTDEVESEGVRRAMSRADDADIKILMFEAEKNDAQTLAMADENSIIVINKIDKAKANSKGIEISVKTGAGLDKLLAAMNKKIVEEFTTSEQPLITRARHREALHKALKSLEDFAGDKSVELMAEDLRYAAVEIGRITGQVAVDDILDVIFSSFCIGK